MATRTHFISSAGDICARRDTFGHGWRTTKPTICSHRTLGLDTWVDDTLTLQANFVARTTHFVARITYTDTTGALLPRGTFDARTWIDAHTLYARLAIGTGCGDAHIDATALHTGQKVSIAFATLAWRGADATDAYVVTRTEGAFIDGAIAIIVYGVA